jgi:kynurenine formamidase
MRRVRAIALFVPIAFVLVLTTPTSDAQSARIVDLGHPLTATDPTWNGQKVFNRSTSSTVEKDGLFTGHFYSDEHFGTHVDAPAHFASGGWTVDQIPPDRLLRPGVNIDVRAQVRENEDYRVTVADIQAAEKHIGGIPDAATILITTGWDTRWNEGGRYMNVRGGVKHFPGLSVEAATYLARELRVAAIGIDTPSVDYGPSTEFEVHRTTHALNVYHIENATNLAQLPDSGFMVIVAPLNLAGGSGSPARMFALFDQQ